MRADLTFDVRRWRPRNLLMGTGISATAAPIPAGRGCWATLCGLGRLGIFIRGVCEAFEFRLLRGRGCSVKLVVVGGTGLIGSRLIERLGGQDVQVKAVSPSLGVNTYTGEGLRTALEGSQVVIDVSNSRSLADESVLDFFTTSTRNILDTERSSDVGHHVALSVVGTERLQESGYFRAKMAQENLIKESSVSFSIVRATQFFEFIGTIADAATDASKVLLPPELIQPMAAEDVAAMVADISLGEPINGTVEIAGPERFRLDELVERSLKARNDPRQVVTDPTGRYFGAQLGELTLIPGKNARLGGTRFEDWLMS